MSQVLLEADQIKMYFGGIKALDGVSLSVGSQTIHTVIGPNGSGKSTMFNVLTGFYRATGGHIAFCGKEITGSAPHRISEMGMARTFQTLRLFPEMTVLENVIVGMHSRIRETFWSAALHLPSAANEERVAYEKAEQILEMVGLSAKNRQPAKSLAYGEGRLLEIARAMASEPKVLLLDEPAAGMNPSETKQVMELIRKLCQRGLTIVLVEHDMKVVISYSDMVTVLDHGKKIAEGAPKEILQNEAVITAYLGKRREHHA